MNKEVFVLTHCTAEKDCAPKVFTSKKAAMDAFREQYYDMCRTYVESIKDCYLLEDTAIFVHDDDTYDTFQVFKVPVIEGGE